MSVCKDNPWHFPPHRSLADLSPTMIMRELKASGKFNAYLCCNSCGEIYRKSLAMSSELSMISFKISFFSLFWSLLRYFCGRSIEAARKTKGNPLISCEIYAFFRIIYGIYIPNDMAQVTPNIGTLGLFSSYSRPCDRIFGNLNVSWCNNRSNPKFSDYLFQMIP